MQRAKAFFVTFFISFSVMLCCFMALYWFVDYSDYQSAGESQTGIPVLTPDYNDTKTTLLIFDAQNADFFFLLKLNALQKKVSFISIPSSFYLSQAGRTLGESMDYAGAMQCVQDLSGQFDISIDHHLLCDGNSLAQILSSFSATEIQQLSAIPQSVKEYLLKGSRYIDTSALINAIDISSAWLDNSVGIEFLNICGLYLIQNNMQNICDYALDELKENSSYLTTNINTKDIDRLKRICGFLPADGTIFERYVADDTETAQSEIDRLLKQ